MLKWKKLLIIGQNINHQIILKGIYSNKHIRELKRDIKEQGNVLVELNNSVPKVYNLTELNEK